jgi:putative ABC transport system permease protein
MNPALEAGPILRSLRHHKGTFSLLVLEVALGFVMLTHTLIMARYYFRLHVSPTGMREDELVVARRRFLHPRDTEVARATVRADLAALAGTGAPVAAIDAAPLPNSADFPTVLTRPGDRRETLAWSVRATSGIAPALGLQVVAGTGLDGVTGGRYADGATAVLLTWTAAEKVFGTAGAALGRDVHGSTFGRGRVTGVVRDFAFRGSWVPGATSITVVAAEPITEHELVYVMHVAGGNRAALVGAATRALAGTADADSTIVVNGLDRNTTRFSTISQGAVIIALWTGFLVVAVALAGSLALASFSVAERTRQIGVRRALGASRGEIVRYFLLENLILTGFGLALGLGLAVAMNQVLRRIMSDLTLTPQEVLASMAIFIGSGLLSALVPARRAAAIPPWAATRTL